MEYKEKGKIEKNNKEKANKNNQELLKRNKEKNNSKFNYNIKAKNSNAIYLKKKNLLIYQPKYFFNLITYFYLIKLYIITFMKLSSILCKFNKRNILFQISEVTLKINETGTIQILSDDFFQNYIPCSVYINGNNESQIKNKYSFTHQESGINTVRIIWNTEIKSTQKMFCQCNKIVEIDLSKFDTTSVSNMQEMFYECSTLKSINFLNVDTSKVTIMAHMFYHCASLISLDLSNFNTTKVKVLPSMFLGCSNLEYINFNLLNPNKYNSYEGLFQSVSEKLIACSINEDSLLSKLLTEKKDVQCKNFNSNSNTINKCYSQETTFAFKNICDICGKNYVRKDNAPNNDNAFINCFEEKNGYYLDETIWIYKPCYKSCKICKKNGNEEENNCVECKDDYKYEINISNSDYKNCYINNPFEIITSEINVLNIETTSMKINFVSNQTNIILYIIENLINDFNNMDINNGNDSKVIYKNKQILLTSVINQKNHEEENNITMDLGQCEDTLKNSYNISNDAPLYIIQIISEEIGMKIPIIEYQIYYPLYNDNELIKLNLSLCQDTKIDLSISVKIDGKLEKYNPRSDYYNNICFKTTSESGTDITLKDRRNEFVQNNRSLCEENCILKDYDYIKEKAKCSCDIKTDISLSDIKFNKNEFFKSFTDINNIFNINILKCHKTVLKIKELKNNYGFFIISFFFIGISLYFKPK